jgi:hypothetical protein
VLFSTTSIFKNTFKTKIYCIQIGVIHALTWYCIKQSYAVICMLIAEALGHKTLGQKLSLIGQNVNLWPEN